MQVVGAILASASTRKSLHRHRIPVVCKRVVCHTHCLSGPHKYYTLVVSITLANYQLRAVANALVRVYLLTRECTVIYSQVYDRALASLKRAGVKLPVICTVNPKTGICFMMPFTSIVRYSKRVTVVCNFNGVYSTDHSQFDIHVRVSSELHVRTQ